MLRTGLIAVLLLGLGSTAMASDRVRVVVGHDSGYRQYDGPRYCAGIDGYGFIGGGRDDRRWRDSRWRDPRWDHRYQTGWRHGRYYSAPRGYYRPGHYHGYSRGYHGKQWDHDRRHDRRHDGRYDGRRGHRR